MEKALLIPDQHIPFNDKRYWKLLLKVAKSLKPKHLIIMGDFIDCYAVSSHRKDPARKVSLLDELREAERHLDQLDRIPGVKNKVYLEGNHENRLTRYLQDRAPDLIGTHPSIPGILNLRDRGWRWLGYNKSYKLGKLFLTHDLGSAGATAHSKACVDCGGSIAIGHTHRLAVSYRGTTRGKVHLGATLGWGGDVSAIDYMHRTKAMTQWVHGFGIANIAKNGNVYVTAIPVVDYSACVEGRLITVGK